MSAPLPVKVVEFIVSTWIHNTPNWMQPDIGWKVYFFIIDHYPRL